MLRVLSTDYVSIGHDAESRRVTPLVTEGLMRTICNREKYNWVVLPRSETSDSIRIYEQ